MRQLAEDDERTTSSAGLLRRRNGGAETAKTILRQLDVWLVVVLMVVAGRLISRYFATEFNFRSVINQCAVIGLLATGQYLVILSGGFDLSVASVMAFGNVVTAHFATHLGLGAIAISLPACTLLCLINGLVITKLDVPPFIATLGMLGVGSGLAFAVASSPIVVTSSGFARLSSFSLGPLSFVGLIWIAAIATLWVSLRTSRWGLHIAAIGGSESAARLAGVDTTRVKISVYALSGFLAGLGGVLYVVVANSGVPNVGTGWELITIAMVVIGGSNLFGGSGKLINVVGGVLVYELISNLMNFANVDASLQDAVAAVIVIVVVSLRLVQQNAAAKGSRA